jgi:O-antigen/teichoic acid export membrane protein/lysophospholipase L1-like esterase
VRRGAAAVLREGAWIGAGQAATAVAVLVGTRLLTELLPPAVYGTVGLLLGVMAFGRNLACTPLLQAALRFHPDAVRTGGIDALRRVVTGDLLRVASLIGLALAVGGALVGPSLGVPLTPFLLLGVLLLADVARGLELNLLNAARRQAAFALWSAADAWARPALAVAAVAALGATPSAVLLGFLVASAGLWVPTRRVSATATHGAGTGAGDVDGLRKQVRRYALPLSGLALAGWVSSVGDRYLIAAWLGTREVGLYAAVYGLVSAPFLMAQSVIESSLRPVYFDAVAGGDHGRAARTLSTWAWTTAAVGLAGTILAAVAHRPLATLALGGEYRDASPLMPWIAGGYALLTLAHVFEKPCYAYRKTGWVLAIQAGGALACVTAVPVLVHLRGTAGAAQAVPLYFGVQLALAVAAARAARSASSPGGRLVRSTAIALAAVLAFLVALEGGLRVYHATKAWRARRALPPVRERCLIPSDDPQLLYELNPGWTDGGFSVNSHGMADRELTVERPPGVLRVAFLGDSITCGFRIIPRRDLYLSRLEELLAARAGAGRGVQCLNFGVNGYGALQELHVARTRARRFDPQVIVAQLCLNDPYPTETDYADLAPSHPLRTYDFLFRRLDPPRFWAYRFVMRTHDEAGRRHLRAALQGLGALGRQGPPVLAVLFPYLHRPAYASWGFAGYHAEFHRAAEAAGLPFLDLYDRFTAEGLIDDRWPKDPVHPDARGHRVAARAILDEMDRRRLLPPP